MPEVVDGVRKALGEKGFGILTEIDVAATMKKKLDKNLERYLILGACSPAFAHLVLENCTQPSALSVRTRRAH